MPTNIFSIQPREINFRTQTNADWLDGLLVWQAGSAAVIASPLNSGDGVLTVSAVSPMTLLGAHTVTVLEALGLPRFTVADPSGSATAQGAAGVETFAGGINFTLNAGSTHFAVGDTFVISVLPTPVDITGIAFDLQARLSHNNANVALTASSAPSGGAPPTIVTGGAGGQVALRVLREVLSRSRFAPGTYVYDILASADGVSVPAFYGTIQHFDGVAFLP